MGEIEKDGGVLVIRRIHVVYRLEGVERDQRGTVERVLGLHVERCPVARSIGGCIEISTSVEYA